MIRLSPHDQRSIEKMMQFIDLHYREHLSADQLSLDFNMSKTKIQAGIQAVTGLTLHNYILQVRVEKAKLMLIDTNEPVKSISRAIGFKRPSHFIFTFKGFTSLTPVEYRLRSSI